MDIPARRRPDGSRAHLRIEPGEFVVLCGASGSGKSTALRLMNGLIPHFHEDGVLVGNVTVNGLVTASAALDDLGIVTGTVLQHPRRQFFADSAREEIAFAMEQFGMPPEHIRERVEHLIRELEGSLPLDQRLQHLSGGQQQQVAIAAATAHEPRVLLLDEPSSNLSVDAVERLTATLTSIKAAGITVVIAEHRLRYLQHLLDRVIVMRDGAVRREWSASQFRQVSDAALAREGLRGASETPRLQALPATGMSIANASSECAVAGGLELVDIRCQLGGRTVLDIERAMFPSGAVTAIRGVNGAGKSTLARVMTGLQRCAGTVRLGGRKLGRSARLRASAIVMQDVQRQRFSDTVEGELRLAGRGALGSTQAAEVLDSLDLAHLADRHPLSLSGGQQQRLVIAAVRLANRRIIVFDEPSSGVDRRHLESISQQIRTVAESGAVVVLISHDDGLLALAADYELTLTPPEAAVRAPRGARTSSRA